MTPGPHYYRLADGRQFYEYSRDELAPMCKGLDAWDVHCIISAAEHYFRMGAKEGETETDLEACRWWVERLSGDEASRAGIGVMLKVMIQRVRVGR